MMGMVGLWLHDAIRAIFWSTWHGRMPLSSWLHGYRMAATSPGLGLCLGRKKQEGTEGPMGSFPRSLSCPMAFSLARWLSHWRGLSQLLSLGCRRGGITKSQGLPELIVVLFPGPLSGPGW